VFPIHDDPGKTSIIFEATRTRRRTNALGTTTVQTTSQRCEKVSLDHKWREASWDSHTVRTSTGTEGCVFGPAEDGICRGNRGSRRMPAATDAKQPLPARRVRRLLQPFWASVASNHCRVSYDAVLVCPKHQIASVAVTWQRSAPVQSPDTNQGCRNDGRDCVNVSFGRGPGTGDHVSATCTHYCGVAVDQCLSVQTWTECNLSHVARRCLMSTLPRFLHVRHSLWVLFPSVHASPGCRRDDQGMRGASLRKRSGWRRRRRPL